MPNLPKITEVIVIDLRLFSHFAPPCYAAALAPSSLMSIRCAVLRKAHSPRAWHDFESTQCYSFF